MRTEAGRAGAALLSITTCPQPESAQAIRDPARDHAKARV